MKYLRSIICLEQEKDGLKRSKATRPYTVKNEHVRNKMAKKLII